MKETRNESERQAAGADQIRELLPLIGAEHAVHATEGVQNGLLEALGSLDAKRPARGGLGLVEALAGHGVREGRQGATRVDRGLRALGLELVEDGRKPLDLLLLEPQLVGQETQGPADAEDAEGGATVLAFLPELDRERASLAEGFLGGTAPAGVVRPRLRTWETPGA